MTKVLDVAFHIILWVDDRVYFFICTNGNINRKRVGRKYNVQKIHLLERNVIIFKFNLIVVF